VVRAGEPQLDDPVDPVRRPVLRHGHRLDDVVLAVAQQAGELGGDRRVVRPPVAGELGGRQVGPALEEGDALEHQASLPGPSATSCSSAMSHSSLPMKCSSCSKRAFALSWSKAIAMSLTESNHSSATPSAGHAVRCSMATFCRYRRTPGMARTYAGWSCCQWRRNRSE